MKLVIDASVAVKWILGDQPNEADVDRALALLGAVARRVVARLKPDRAVAAIGLLSHSRFSLITSRAAYRRAADLSVQSNAHLFDTLYHAVALEEQATLVTADEAYFNKAKALGAIQQLWDFAL